MTVLWSNCEAQIREAYRQMAREGRYRPMAPGDGCGNISAPLESLDLESEAREYARHWWAAEDEMEFTIGCCDFQSRPATIFAIEAARNMCSGHFGARTALRLLRMAVAEMERVTSDPRFLETEEILYGDQWVYLDDEEAES